MATINNMLNNFYEKTDNIGVGDYILAYGSSGELIYLARIVSTSPKGDDTEEGTTTTTKTTSTTSTTTVATEPEDNQDTFNKNPYGNLSGGTYEDENTATPADIGYAVVDIATGESIVTQCLSLRSLLRLIGDKYSSYKVIDGSDIVITIGLVREQTTTTTTTTTTTDNPNKDIFPDRDLVTY